MASVQFTWSDMWLRWFNVQTDEQVKREFLEQIEIIELMKMSTPKIQIEILECAPKELIKVLKPILHDKTIEKLLPKEKVKEFCGVEILSEREFYNRAKDIQERIKSGKGVSKDEYNRFMSCCVETL